ncbi:uncharacterized protein LOC144770264 [Lissotriton helveticus]
MLLDPAPLCSVLLLLCCCFEPGANQSIDQQPAFISVTEDAAINITCVVPSYLTVNKMSLRRGVRELLHFSKESGSVSSEGNEFAERVQVFGTAMSITITLRQLRKNDTDWYMCVGNKTDPHVSDVYGPGTVLIVTGEMQPCQLVEARKWEKSLLIVFALVTLALCTVIIMSKVEIKQGNRSQKKCTTNTVYEVMTGSVRRNSVTRPHFNNSQNVTDNNALGSNTMGNGACQIQPPMGSYWKTDNAYSNTPY